MTTKQKGFARDLLLERAGSMEEKDDWKRRHAIAWRYPRTNEGGIVALVTALATLVDAHAMTWDAAIGDDFYAGPYVEDIARAAIKLLSTDIGRLDGGTLDKLIRDIANLGGIDGDKL